MSNFNPGHLVYWRGQPAVVLEYKGLNDLVIRLATTGDTEIVRSSDLSTSIGPEDVKKISGQHLTASDKEWDVATERYNIILPLLSNPRRTREQVEDIAKKHGKGVVTIYRWIKAFEETGLVSSLLRQGRADKGETRLDDEVEQVVDIAIKEHYLTSQRKSGAKTYQYVKLECYKLGLPAPHINTVHSRIAKITEREKVKSRLGKKQFRQQYEPKLGSFPGADYPNAVVQIDHTPVDVIVVDQDHRHPIGRPYLTIAIDVATKMISGFTMTLEAPSALSAGLCIGHAILPKDNWLALNEIDAEWPIYGKMQKIHVDNAKEFRGNMLRRACQQHGIILEFRPKGCPNYGPDVERAFRTFMQEAHEIPGTTFSNIQQKLDYNSEGKACMTLPELNLWFSYYVLYCYHNMPHRGISKVAPINEYSRFIMGDSERPGIGPPMPVPDEERLKLDFTPYVERTIQRQGIEIDNIHYYSDALRKWIGAKDPENPSKTRKFIFARDPRSINPVYFFDPDTESYVPVPFLNTSRPTASLWELRAARKTLKDENKDINEEMLFKGIQKMRDLVDESVERTRLAKQQRATEKRARRMAERRKHWEVNHEVAKVDLPTQDDDDDDDIQPFSEVDF